jgi:hypothetical protein
MPLTPNEFVKIVKTILFSETMNINGHSRVSKSMMISILNDYCPAMNAIYAVDETNGKEVVTWNEVVPRT